MLGVGGTRTEGFRGGAVTITIFGALTADPTHFIGGPRTSLTIAAVLLLATVAISLRIRPTDHRCRSASNSSKENQP